MLKGQPSRCAACVSVRCLRDGTVSRIFWQGLLSRAYSISEFEELVEAVAALAPGEMRGERSAVAWRNSSER